MAGSIKVLLFLISDIQYRCFVSCGCSLAGMDCHELHDREYASQAILLFKYCDKAYKINVNILYNVGNFLFSSTRATQFKTDCQRKIYDEADDLRHIETRSKIDLDEGT